MTTDAPHDEPDPDELRAAVRERWERAADGWQKRSARFQAAAMPVSQWMIEAIEPQPGQRVLELAAGLGETGFLAAELIAPGGGTLISSDGAEGMLAHARARAQALGLRNVDFKLLELEWIDLPAASVDAVLCRWGYMLALDKAAAFRETRRVLRPGGRLALAAWSTPERVPFASIPRQALVEAGLVDGFGFVAGPGMFDLSDPDALRALLEQAGFAEVVVEELPLTIRFGGVEDLIAATRDLSPAFADVVDPLDERQRADLIERLAAATAPFAASDGSLALPATALVAAAEA
jgi:ubiquinone/menaquinone biosynthesis C-methylase UbiE